jgi:hypothetical protein
LLTNAAYYRVKFQFDSKQVPFFCLSTNHNQADLLIGNVQFTLWLTVFLISHCALFSSCLVKQIGFFFADTFLACAGDAFPAHFTLGHHDYSKGNLINVNLLQPILQTKLSHCFQSLVGADKRIGGKSFGLTDWCGSLTQQWYFGHFVLQGFFFGGSSARSALFGMRLYDAPSHHRTFRPRYEPTDDPETQKRQYIHPKQAF